MNCNKGPLQKWLDINPHLNGVHQRVRCLNSPPPPHLQLGTLSRFFSSARNRWNARVWRGPGLHELLHREPLQSHRGASRKMCAVSPWGHARKEGEVAKHGSFPRVWEKGVWWKGLERHDLANMWFGGKGAGTRPPRAPEMSSILRIRCLKRQRVGAPNLWLDDIDQPHNPGHVPRRRPNSRLAIRGAASHASASCLSGKWRIFPRRTSSQQTTRGPRLARSFGMSGGVLL